MSVKTRLLVVMVTLMACGSSETPLARLQTRTSVTTLRTVVASTTVPTSTTVGVARSTTTSLSPAEADFVAWARQAGAGPMDTRTILDFGTNTCELADRGTSVLYSFWATLLTGETATVRSQVLAVMGAAGVKLCPEKLPAIQPAIQRLAGN